MSMDQYTVLQLVLQFGTYGFMVVLLPGLLFHKKLQRFPLAVRFMIYQLIGNFYLMNVVFILQLLHICNPFTLWLVTIIFVVGITLKNTHNNLFRLLEGWMEYWRRLLTGTVGKRSLWYRVGLFFKGVFRGIWKWIKRYGFPYLPEWILLFGIFGYMFYIRGATYFQTYGYYASDLMVHNYWVNGLSNGKLFVAGIYPYGYHCVLYSLHAMFGLKTVNIMRLFGLVQYTFVLLNLFAFLRAIGKTRFLPFVGVITISGWSLWMNDALIRFSSPLPQEFGCIFIFPAMYFAIRFFKERSTEKKKEKEKAKGRKGLPFAAFFSRFRRKPKKIRRDWKNPEKQYLLEGELFYFATGAEEAAFAAEEKREILPFSAYNEDGTVKEEFRLPEEPVPEEGYPENYAEEDYPVTFAEEDYPETFAEEDYPVTFAEGDYPETFTEEDYPETFAEGEDYPETFAEEEDYPVTFAGDMEVFPDEASEDDYLMVFEDGGDYPVTYDEEGNAVLYEAGEDDYPEIFEDADFAGIFDENGVEVGTQSEKTGEDTWENITAGIFTPGKRSLTWEEKRKLERMRKWHKTKLYAFYRKHHVFFDKIINRFRARKFRPIHGIIEYVKSFAPSTWCLLFFAMSFSMTFSVHFYVTMSLGLGCIGLALAFFTQFFRWRYLKSVLLALLASLLFAIYPMAIAYAGGTPLQGSMNWAMSVMKGDEEKLRTGTVEINGVTYYYTLAAGEDEETYINELRKMIEGGYEDMDLEGEYSTEEEETELSAKEKLLSKKDVLDGIMEAYVIRAKEGEGKDEVEINPLGIGNVNLVYLMVAAAFLLGLLAILRDRYSSRALIALAIFAAFHLFVFLLSEFGLPQLMDENRNRSFFAYAFAAMTGLAFDQAVYTLLGFKKIRVVMNLTSLAALISVVYFLYRLDWVQLTPIHVGSLQTNGAMVSTLNIINDFPKYHWTIVTANDEVRMVEEYGRHTEVITFLRTMEDYDATSSEMFIPTDYVFFYIEKIPGDYTNAYEGSGQPVSEAGASRSLPKGNRTLEVYSGEARWITMSHMYYWAQKFMELFPNEMEVLYEDEEFVCYKITQNTYSLYNFAINYGFNAKSNTDHRRRRSEG